MRPDIQAYSRYLAACEVGANIAGLTKALASSPTPTAGGNVAEEILEPVRDFASAASAAGWRFNGDTASLMFINETTADLSSAADWKALCASFGINALEREVVQVRIVTPALGEALGRLGEQVRANFFGLSVWARTRDVDLTDDPTIQAIASEAVVLGRATRSNMFGRSEVAALIAAASTGRSLLDDAIEAHIYSDDDVIGDDCPFTENVEDVGNAVRAVALEFGLSAD